MLEVLFEVIAPVLAVAVVGGLVGRWLGVPVKNLSALSFNLFSPALVFRSMSSIDIGGGDTTAILAVMAMVAVAQAVVSTAVSRVRRHQKPVRSAVALTAAIGNHGNLGLPVSLLAFGQAGFDVAIIAFVASAVLTNSLGVVLASPGATVGSTLRALVTVPSLWAAVVGLLVNSGEIGLPTFVDTGASTLADAAVPVMLVVLGLQMNLDIVGGGDVGALGQSLLVRMVAGPALALGTSTLVGLDGVTQDTLVVLGGMPPAVFTTILATQYGARPELVTRAVVIGTIISVGTLTVLISMYR